MIEYQYIAVTAEGERTLSFPLPSHDDQRLASYQEFARRHYGKRATVRVEQRTVTSWEPLPATQPTLFTDEEQPA